MATLTQIVDVVLRSGDTFDKTLIWEHTGVAVDLTDWTGTALVKALPTDADEDAIAEFEVIETDAEAGEFTINLDPNDSADLPVGDSVAVYEVQFVHTDGRKRTPVAGSVSVEPA